MGLFTFIKNLFSKVEKVETAVENLIIEATPVLPKETATNLRNEVAKVKKTTKEAKVKVEAVEAKVKSATTKKPKTSAEKKTTK
jgi:hypothetical protein